jgi:hypothetical protein
LFGRNVKVDDKNNNDNNNKTFKSKLLAVDLFKHHLGLEKLLSHVLLSVFLCSPLINGSFAVWLTEKGLLLMR